MKRFFAILAFCVVAIASAELCHAQFSKLSFGKYGVSSIRPESLRSVSGAVWVDVTNPMEGFTVSEIKGTVYKKGVPFVYGSASDVHIPSGSARAQISGRASLRDTASLWDVLALIVFDPKDYSVDLSVRITLDSGETRVVSKSKMPVAALLKLI
jgi:hypothetical protein